MIGDRVDYIVAWLEVKLPRGFRFLYKHKAITTFFVYATRREQDGDPGLLTTFLRAAKDFPMLSDWTRCRVGAVMSGLLKEDSSDLQKRAAVLAALFVPQT